ncbi:MAG TPA: PAS domain-containing protein [Pararhizobium sp.]|nr:PAS domain-containing protein [Pararhizobium sp.]
MQDFDNHPFRSQIRLAARQLRLPTPFWHASRIFDHQQIKAITCAIVAHPAAGRRTSMLMKHKASLALFDYWNRRRGTRPAPLRRDIEPADIRSLLPNVFILERSDRGAVTFRLAGTGICNMLGRELKGDDLATLWLPAAGESALKLAGSVLDDVQPVVIEAIGESLAGRELPLEFLLLPVATSLPSADRIFGVLTPGERPFWIDLDPVIGCITTSLRTLDPSKEPIFLANRPGIPVPPATRAFRGHGNEEPRKQLPHLTVLEGGLRD